MSVRHSPKYFITRLEPTEYQHELYGKQVEFNRDKSHIAFHSQFHSPGYLQFSQIEHMTITYDRKRTLLWWSICTFLLGIGILLFLVRIRLPPWRVRIRIKQQDAPVTIRAWLSDQEAEDLYQFTRPLFSVDYHPKHSK